MRESVFSSLYPPLSIHIYICVLKVSLCHRSSKPVAAQPIWRKHFGSPRCHLVTALWSQQVDLELYGLRLERTCKANGLLAGTGGLREALEHRWPAT